MIVIADLASISKDGMPFGHYEYVSNMYQQILKDKDARIANGYKNVDSRNHNDICLDRNVNLYNQSGLIRIRNLLTVLHNGRQLFKSFQDGIFILQPYSMLGNLLSLFYKKKNQRVYLIEYKYRIRTALEKIVYYFVKSRINGFICSLDEVGKKYGLKYIVLPDYIYMSEETPRKKEKKYDFGVVGRITDNKDVETVIRTVNSSDYSLIVAGDFSDKERYQSIVAENHNKKIIVVDSYLSDEEYRRLVSECRYIILPYREYYKGTSSGVVYDTIFSGVPVIIPSYETFKFVTDYGVGIQYEDSFANVDLKEAMKMSDDYELAINGFLLKNAESAEKLRRFLL